MPSTSSRVCITVSNSPNPSRGYIRLCNHGKRFLLLNLSTLTYTEFDWMLLRALQRFAGVLSQRFLSVSVSPERGNSWKAFHCFSSVMGACSSYCVRAHGWVARICQPWEQSSSRSWLSIVEAPGCLRHPASTSNSNFKNRPPPLPYPPPPDNSKGEIKFAPKFPAFHKNTLLPTDLYKPWCIPLLHTAPSLQIRSTQPARKNRFTSYGTRHEKARIKRTCLTSAFLSNT